MSLVEKTQEALRLLKGTKDVSLNPFQVRAIKMIEERDDNFLVVAPTGAGKTMIGVAGILKYGRGFYLAPLRSLMREKYVEFRKMFPRAKVVITNKDYSIPRRRLKEADIRILSPYKFTIYLDVLDPDDGVVVVDEIHSINKDPEMEAAVSSIKAEGFRIIGLSATVHEDDIPKMSRWLNATAIIAKEKRPVPLKFTEVKLQLGPGYVYVEKGGGYLNIGEKYHTKYHAIVELVLRIYRRDPSGGILVWSPLRREADMIASMIASKMPVVLPEMSKQVLASNEHDRVLKRTIEKGVLLHHGGLSSRNREVVEELFKSKKANIIVSCYTLSHGVNFPVRYLVVTTLFDFSGKPVDPSTFHQIAGRAGRPGLDDFGEVITVTVGELESYILTKLLSEKASRVRSRLYNPWYLTKLAAQRLAFDHSIDGFVHFLKETYYVQEHGPRGLEELKKLAEKILETVIDSYFVIEGERVYPKDRPEAIAASMGLHPKEWAVYVPMSRGDYRQSVLKAVEAASEATGIKDMDVMSKILEYGFLAIYLGSWKAREVAEATQTVLDAVAVYTRRLHGWSSQEFQNAKNIAEMYIYGGNPNAVYLANTLRYDEMKRIVRNIPQILINGNISDNNVLDYVRHAVKLVFEFKKVIYLRRVRNVVDAVLKTIYGEEVPKTIISDAHRVAREEISRIVREMGAKVVNR